MIDSNQAQALRRRRQMKAIVRTINVGEGDCIAFQLKEGGDSFNVLIDCGQFNENVRSLVEVDFNRHIHLLVATHIDNDHIAGLGDMLASDIMQNLRIDKIWFNCYQQVPDNAGALPERARNLAAKLKTKLRRQAIPNAMDISVRDAKLLSEAILANEAWSQNWNMQPVKQGEELSLGEGGRWGLLKVISPTDEDFEKTQEDFKNLFCSELMTDAFDVYAHSEYLYELLIRIDQEDVVEDDEPEDAADEALSRKTTEALSRTKQKYDSSNWNKSSLAFVWEKNGHRILFAGDAAFKNIVDGLNTLYPGEQTHLLDAVKVPHHGSECNTSEGEMAVIDSECFIITGSKEGKRPSRVTLARIVGRELPKDANGAPLFDKRHIHCNAMAEQMRLFVDAKDDVKEELHYDIDVSDLNLCYEKEI